MEKKEEEIKRPTAKKDEILIGSLRFKVFQNGGTSKFKALKPISYQFYSK